MNVPLRIIVAGGGNVCHAISGMLASYGHKVTVLTRKPSMWTTTISVSFMGNIRKGALEFITHDVSNLHGRYDAIIVSCPICAFKPIALNLSKLRYPTPIICAPGRLFNQEVMGTELINWPMCLLNRTPYICRVSKYGSGVTISGTAHGGLAYWSSTEFPTNLIHDLFQMQGSKITSSESINLSNSNSLHTERLHELVEHSNPKRETTPLFHTESGNAASRKMLNCDLELQELIEKTSSPERLYCDGVFDLFHSGHLIHLQTLASKGKHLIVGVVGDEDSRGYKRRPVWTEAQRSLVLGSLGCVSSVICPCPLVMTEEFIKQHRIDAVYHAFGSAADRQKQAVLFAAPIGMGIFHTIPYNHGISTTQRIVTNGWVDIWERKGRSQDRKDVRLLTGYEGTDFDPAPYAERWKSEVQWRAGDSVLDVGCGAGFLGEWLPNDAYIGVEQSQSLTDAFVERTQRTVLTGDARKLPFADGAFDHVICHSMLQYMPSKEAALDAIQEMRRVTRTSVFIGDLRSQGHTGRGAKHVMKGTIGHVLFQRLELETLGFITSDGWWGGETRFNGVWARSDRLYHLAIIGGGPAGCGLLTCAALQGEYESLLHKRVVLFDAKSQLGNGATASYTNVRSNSHGCALWDPFDKLDIEPFDPSLNVDEVIPMRDMSRLLSDVGTWHHHRLDKHPESDVHLATKVDHIQEEPDGTYRIRYRDANGERGGRNVRAQNVCVCTGGTPVVPTAFPSVLHAEDYFQGTATPQPGTVAIVGYSHSAFALADLWVKICPESTITFVRQTGRRGPPLIYFPTTQDAIAAPYAFEPADVCPETDRVHRFGGLRGDARRFALEHDFAVAEVGMVSPDHFEHTVVACGYRLREMAMVDRHGNALRPSTSSSGTSVDADGRLFADHNVFAFGLGSGLRPNDDTGGEPSCSRRADGVWLYQHTVGALILRALEERATDWKRVYNRIADSADDDTPLHHIGGYTQFDQDDWDSQVRQLIEAAGIRLDVDSHVHESGVGAGAFLDSLTRVFGCRAIQGCDYAQDCVAVASHRLPYGRFWTGNACDLDNVPDASQTLSLMFGVTPYMNNLDDVETAVRHLLRITRPGGWVLVAENNDLAKTGLARSLRAATHTLPVDHLNIPVDFWKRFGDAQVLQHAEIGLRYSTAPYRYSVVMHI